MPPRRCPAVAVAAQDPPTRGGGSPAAGSDDPIFLQMAAPGQTIFAASGDSGAYKTGSSYPAYDIDITAVGGTVLSTNSSGAWAGETAWGRSGGCYAGSLSIPSWRVSAVNGANKGSTTLRNAPTSRGDSPRAPVAYA